VKLRQARKVFTRMCLMGYRPEFEGRWWYRECTIDRAFRMVYRRGPARYRRRP